MWVCYILPIISLIKLFLVEKELLVYINTVCNIAVVDFYTERVIDGSNRLEFVTEGKLSDEATGPGLLLLLFFCLEGYRVLTS